MTKSILTLFVFATVAFSAKAQSAKETQTEKHVCTGECCAKKDKTPKIQCNLTSPELQKRKATVLASLKKKVLQKKELENGYSYKFPGNDGMLDELVEFIKTERACCPFFVFNLSVSDSKSEIWMKMTGPEGAKEMIESELKL